MRFQTDRWGGLALRLGAIIGSYASVVGLFFTLVPSKEPLTAWALVFLGLTVGLALLSIGLEVQADRRAHKGRHIFDTSDKSGIRAYMQTWVHESGRAAIWSRDLSWANDETTLDVLLAKARTGNLTLCLPRETDVSRELAGAGADVRIYQASGLEFPASRFTIAYFGNGGSRVAIGREVAGKHVIDELDNTNPAFHMASDLVDLAELLARR
jgi:hypothetical protein